MSAPRQRRRIAAAGLLALALVARAWGQTPGPSQPEHMPQQGGMAKPEMDVRAARRFPQPVQAGSLIGRDLLEPEESQPVLGRVADVVRGGDGAVGVVVRLDGRLGLGWLDLRWLGWWGFEPRIVNVPVEAVALLGEHVALLGLKPDDLRALPSFVPGSQPEIGPDTTIQVGIVRPFH